MKKLIDIDDIDIEDIDIEVMEGIDINDPELRRLRDKAEARDQYLADKEDPRKQNIPSYEFVSASKLEEGEEPLGRVVGHENQKKELLLVIDWFKNSKFFLITPSWS